MAFILVVTLSLGVLYVALIAWCCLHVGGKFDDRVKEMQFNPQRKPWVKPALQPVIEIRALVNIKAEDFARAMRVGEKGLAFHFSHVVLCGIEESESCDIKG